MMRSGTTLVEQIISAHSQVTGRGELGYLGRLGQDLNRTTTSKRENIKQLRESYLASLKQHNPEAAFITDKMPANFKFINLIKVALPEAKLFMYIAIQKQHAGQVSNTTFHPMPTDFANF